MQKSYLYADGMNRHHMDDAQNKNSGKGETGFQLMFSGEQGQVTNDQQIMWAFEKKAAFVDWSQWLLLAKLDLIIKFHMLCFCVFSPSMAILDVIEFDHTSDVWLGKSAIHIN